MSHAVFVSYSSHDWDVAELVRRALEDNGIPCWIAPRDVLASMNYGAAIIQGIEESKLFLLVMSSQSNESPHVLREVERAASKRIPILPVCIEIVLPSRDLEYFLSSPHWFNASTQPVENHLGRLVGVVKDILGQTNVIGNPAPGGEGGAGLSARVGAVHVSGSQFTLQHFSDYADVPFSVTNLSAKVQKVSQLALTVDDRLAIEKVRLKKAGAILQEFQLEAAIGDEDVIDLLASRHVQLLLNPRASEAFRLKIKGPEGFLLTCRVTAEFFDLEGGGVARVASSPFKIEFPIRSLEALRRRNSR